MKSAILSFFNPSIYFLQKQMSELKNVDLIIFLFYDQLMKDQITKANIHVLKRDEVAPPVQIVPKSLLDTAGLLKDRYADLKKHIGKVHREWSKAD